MPINIYIIKSDRSIICKLCAEKMAGKNCDLLNHAVNQLNIIINLFKVSNFNEKFKTGHKVAIPKFLTFRNNVGNGENETTVFFAR